MPAISAAAPCFSLFLLARVFVQWVAVGLMFVLLSGRVGSGFPGPHFVYHELSI